MTQNQLRYLEHLEVKRSNQAREFETERSNRSNENIKRGQLVLSALELPSKTIANIGKGLGGLAKAKVAGGAAKLLL